MASKKVFADTNYWIAIVHPADPLHEIARRVSETLGISVQIWTTQMVLAEFLNIMAKYGQHLREISTRLVNKMPSNGVQIIEQTPDQFEKSLAFYEQVSDQA